MSGTYRHVDRECLWSVTDQKWYVMHPLYPLVECDRTHDPAHCTCGDPGYVGVVHQHDGTPCHWPGATTPIPPGQGDAS